MEFLFLAFFGIICVILTNLTLTPLAHALDWLVSPNWFNLTLLLFLFVLCFGD